MSEWKTYKLGDLATVKGGKRLPKGQGYSIVRTKHPYIRLVDVKSGKVSDESIEYLEYDTHRKIHRYIVQENDVCLAIVGNTIGLVFYIDRRWNNANLTENAARLTNLKGIESKYLYYYLTSEFGQSEIRKNAIGSAQGKLPMYGIQNIEISLPPLQTQQRIASILSSLDDKIELNRQMNQTLEEMAQAMFKHYFVDGIDEDNLPDGWRRGKLQEEFNIVMGQSPDGKSYNTNGEGTIFYQGRTDFTSRFPEVRMYTTEPKRMANKFDTLVSVRAPVGDVNMANERCCIGRGLSAIQHQTFKPSYTYYSMLGLKSEFNKFEGEGTVFGSINKDSFANIDVIIPSASAIETFEQEANPLDTLIHSNSQETDYLIATRDYLLPKLISGEVIPADLKQVEQAL